MSSPVDTTASKTADGISIVIGHVKDYTEIVSAGSSCGPNLSRFAGSTQQAPAIRLFSFILSSPLVCRWTLRKAIMAHQRRLRLPQQYRPLDQVSGLHETGQIVSLISI